MKRNQPDTHPMPADEARELIDTLIAAWPTIPPDEQRRLTDAMMSQFLEAHTRHLFDNMPTADELFGRLPALQDDNEQDDS